MHTEQLNNLLNAYARENGLGKFTPSKQGTYRLSFKNNLVVHVDSLGNNGTVLLYAEIGSLPGEAQAEVCQSLLKANFPGYETRHNTLAINKQQNSVMLLRPLSSHEYDMDMAAFKKLLNDFTSALSEWRQKFLDGDLSQDNKAEQDEAPSNRFIRG